MKFTPFSFSKINSFEMCPKKFEYNYIEKLRFFVPNMATERGSYVHTLLENDTKSKPTTFKFTLIDDDMQQECISIYEKFTETEWGQFFMQADDAEAEVAFGVKKTDEGLVPCSYYDKEALFRGKIDHFFIFEGVVYVIDWKTGKISSFPAPLQLVMYAVWVFLKYPEINEVFSAFVYVEHPTNDKMIKEYNFTRDMLPKLIEKVIEKIINIEKATEFKKKESVLCNYCDYRKKGLCLETTADEFNDQMANMIKPYQKKVRAGDKDKDGLYYFAHYASDSLWRQDYWEIEYQDGEVEHVSKELYNELKAKGWEEDTKIIRKGNE